MNDIIDNIAAGAQTIGQAIGFDPVGGEKVEPCPPPMIEGNAPFPEPGIYFGMSDEAYHAIHACSASGLKKLSISTMDYWADSVLNPDRDEYRSQKDYFDFGKAIHCFVLEGEAVYNRRYVVGLEKPKGVIETTDQIKLRIVQLGGKPTSKGFDDNTRAAKKEDWIAQLLALDPDAQIWERMQAAFNEANEGAEIVTHKIDKRVRIAAKMIQAHPELKDAFTGGWSEVAVFHYCPETGAPMKSKMDYLKMRAIVDLKSFGNNGGKPINRAIETAIASMRYNVQHNVYDDAVMAVRALIHERGAGAIFTHPFASLDQREAQVAWAMRWAQQPEPPAFMFVFQQSGQAPVTRGRIMPRGTVFSVTRSRVRELKRRWVDCVKTFGTDPWIDVEPIDTIEDEAIPLWATEL